jgi:hypothetical protein
MNETHAKCTRRDLIRRGSSLLATTTLLGTQAAAAVPTSTSILAAPAPAASIQVTGDSPTVSQNARRIGLAAGGI